MNMSVTSLRNWKLVDLLAVLDNAGRLVAKRDLLFKPVKLDSSCRYVIGVPGGRDFHLIITGQKWFDTLSGKGGGGSIDLVMYLFNLPYRAALSLLITLSH